jgi:hypothetical protein
MAEAATRRSCLAPCGRKRIGPKRGEPQTSRRFPPALVSEIDSVAGPAAARWCAKAGAAIRCPCRNFALALPEGLGDFRLDLPSRQTDIVDQMGIGLRHLPKFPAKAYPPKPGRDDASQRRRAVVAARHFRRFHGRSRPRCPRRCRSKGGSIVHGNLHMVCGPGRPRPERG